MQTIEVFGKGRVISASFTRPDNATAYAAGDVICNSTSAPVILTFPRATVTQGPSFSIIAQVVMVDSANQSTKLEAELWLFDTAITMDNDNAAFTPTDAELVNLLGIVELETPYVGTVTSGADGNAVYRSSGLSVPIQTKPSDNAIYGVLVARNAYTPVASESFTIKLGILD
jgi:hypothetical protein